MSSSHGGARPGAGRPPTTKPQAVTIRLPAALLAEVDARRGDVSRSEFLKSIIEAAMAAKD